MDKYKEGVDFEWVKMDNSNAKTRKFFTKAEKKAKMDKKSVEKPMESKPKATKPRTTKKSSSAPKTSKKPVARSTVSKVKSAPEVESSVLPPLNTGNVRPMARPKDVAKKSRDPLQPKITFDPSKKVSYEEWKKMSRAERRANGLSETTVGFQNRGYKKGGMVKANCGASMKPTQRGSK